MHSTRHASDRALWAADRLAPRTSYASCPVVALVLATAVVAGAGAGCSRAKSPEEAHRRFVEAVRTGDPARVFDVLDKQTRWAWMTVQKRHREAHDIVLSTYPEGAVRDTALRRFERGATAGSAKALFADEVGRAALPNLRTQAAAAVVSFETAPDGETASAVTATGERIPFRRGPNGGWGYGGFAADAEDRQRRAIQDLDVVRTNAADYERAAAQGRR